MKSEVNTEKMERNLRYFLDVTFPTYQVDFTEHAKLATFICEKDLLQIQMQGRGAALIHLFSHADPFCLDEDPRGLYKAFLGSLAVRQNKRLHFADRLNHSKAVIFREGGAHS